MVEELLAYLNIYKQCIINGKIEEGFEKRAKKVLEQIINLEQLVLSQQILNSYNFKKLRNEVAFIFHPDHCKSVNGSMESPDVLFQRFSGAIDKINKAIESGYTIKKEPKNNYSYQSANQQQRPNRTYNQQYSGYNPGYNYQRARDAEAQRRQHAYYESVAEESAPTFFNYVSDRFNAIFRSIPSSEDDYTSILEKMQKKLNKLNLQWRDLSFDINVLKSKIFSNNVLRNDATNPRRVKEEYFLYYNTLYEDLCEYDEIKKQRKDALDARFDQLTPLIYSKVQEWKYKYYALVNDLEQVSLEYQNALLVNDNKKIKTLSKKLSVLNVEVATATKTLEKGLERVIAKEVTSSDQLYQDLLAKYNEAAKKYEDANKRYQFVIDHPGVTMDEIRSCFEQEYIKTDRKYSQNLIQLENRMKILECQIKSIEEEIVLFRNKYIRFAPKNKKR